MEQGFAVVLVAGLTVFGLTYIAMESGLSTDTEPEEKIVVFDKNIGAVGDITEDLRTIELGTFSVGEGRGDIQAFRSDEERISNGRIRNNPISFNYEASQPRGGTLNFRVIGRQGSGSVYFKVNGERIFEEPMTSDFSGTGSEIEIEERHLTTGQNSFELGTTKGGVLSSTTYLIEDIELEVNDRKNHQRVENFQMYTNEFENFRGADLDFRIPTDGSIPENPLEIRVNGNTIAEETRGQGEYTVDFSTEDADLRPGQNNIRFSTSGRSFYDIENAVIQVDYAVTSEPESVTDTINIDRNDLDYINREGTQEKIEFQYTNLNNPNNLQIDLNSEEYDLSPQNGRNTVEIDEGILEEENILTLSSQGAFRMENLQITSEKVNEER